MTNELQTTQAPLAPSTAMGNVESNRAMAMVQAQTLMAKQFPRNQIQARNDILEACKRIRLAETAIYRYPRGGIKIEGPSIRLAEAIIQSWGNMDSGVIELERKAGNASRNQPGESLVMVFCMDFQTNNRQQMVFTVPHTRYSNKKGNTILTDPRDIDEMILNKAARRRRACMLAMIPGDIIEEAIDQCNKTLAGNSDKPLLDRIKDMVKAFSEVGVSQTKLEERLGHKMEACIETDIISLRKIYRSLKDGMSKPDDWFAATEKKPVKVEVEIEKFNPESPSDPPQSAVLRLPDNAPDIVKKLYSLATHPDNEEAIDIIGSEEGAVPIEDVLRLKDEPSAEYWVEQIESFRKTENEKEDME